MLVQLHQGNLPMTDRSSYINNTQICPQFVAVLLKRFQLLEWRFKTILETIFLMMFLNDRVEGGGVCQGDSLVET